MSDDLTKGMMVSIEENTKGINAELVIIDDIHKKTLDSQNDNRGIFRLHLCV